MLINTFKCVKPHELTFMKIAADTLGSEEDTRQWVNMILYDFVIEKNVLSAGSLF